MKRLLVARLDNAGDVILSGPAVGAAAAHGRVTFLCSSSGESAARLLPGVAELIVWDAPWVGFDPPRVDAIATDSLVATLARGRFDAAAILTSFHQSPLPLALLLRLAGIPEIAAVSVDYPGSLLDHRVAYRDELHEVEQALTVTTALGFAPPADDGLALIRRSTGGPLPEGGYIVVHPGASVPARRLPDRLALQLIEDLSRLGVRTVLTGSALERETSAVQAADPLNQDLRGHTSLAALVEVIGRARALVVGNTGPAHIAAATGTPVVSVFAPVVPVHRWRPWKVPSVVLGDQSVACAGCRSRICPLDVQGCVEHASADQAIRALGDLGALARPARSLA